MHKSENTRVWLILSGALAVLLFVLVWPRRQFNNTAEIANDAVPVKRASSESNTKATTRTDGLRPSTSRAEPPRSAEETVAAKLKQFAQSRRNIMRAMAKQKGLAVPDSVEKFFDAVESGDWTQIKAAFDTINGGDPSAGHEPKRTPEVRQLWASIIDAYGTAEQVHLWPAQKLLDYGNAILSQLRPGMIYVGGTDEGRWVPTLLNETTEGERHIVITQNGLADGTYLEYLRFLYGDRLNALNAEDSQRAFQDYMAEAQKRFTHDKDFPDEPKQLRAGEDIKVVDNRVNVSGIVAVMDINERLLRALMEKNPEMSFALQESFPLKTTYAAAMPLGPIMELGARDQSSFTSERVSESVAYWRGVADQFRDSPDQSDEQAAVKSQSKLAVGQANLFAERGFSESAEQTYRIALGMAPSNGDAVLGLADLMDRTGRAAESRAMLEQFSRDYPKQYEKLLKFRSSGSVTITKRD